MRAGTPGFIGARLREAREARGLSGTQLADLLGVTRQAVAQYEAGERSPSPEMLTRMSAVLNLPHAFFTRQPVEDWAETIFFRSRKSTTKAARKKARRRRLWLDQITKYAMRHVEIPRVNFPPCNFPADPAKITDEQIEHAATALRRFWGLKDGPISDVTLLLENNGAVAAREPFEESEMDAYSTWADNIPYVILNDDNQSAVRARLNVAHECAHLVLHRNVDYVRLEEREADMERTEEQAYRFAGAFLLPEATFGREFIAPTLDAFLALKPRWKVSITAMVKRAENLGLISPDEARRLWMSIGRRKWRTHEPLDDELTPEYPRLLRRAYELALTEKVISKDDTIAELALATNDVESLAGLPLGTFTNEVPPVRVLPKNRVTNTERSDTNGPGDVVQFPHNDREKQRI